MPRVKQQEIILGLFKGCLRAQDILHCCLYSHVGIELGKIAIRYEDNEPVYLLTGVWTRGGRWTTKTKDQVISYFTGIRDTLQALDMCKYVHDQDDKLGVLRDIS